MKDEHTCSCWNGSIGCKPCFDELRAQVDQLEDDKRRLEEYVKSVEGQRDAAQIPLMRHGLDCEFKKQLEQMRDYLLVIATSNPSEVTGYDYRHCLDEIHDTANRALKERKIL